MQQKPKWGRTEYKLGFCCFCISFYSPVDCRACLPGHESPPSSTAIGLMSQSNRTEVRKSRLEILT